MSRMPDAEVFVTLGVDSHRDTHVAVALDQLGWMLGALEFASTTAGFTRLLGWAVEWGTIDRVGVEGTASYAAGLARWLRAKAWS